VGAAVTQQFSDVPQDATVLHAPGYSDLPEGAQVVSETNADKLRRTLNENRAALSRQNRINDANATSPMGAAVKSSLRDIGDTLNPIENIKGMGQAAYGAASGAIPHSLSDVAGLVDPVAQANKLIVQPMRDTGQVVPILGPMAAGMFDKSMEGHPGQAMGQIGANVAIAALADRLPPAIRNIRAARNLPPNEAVGGINLSAVTGKPIEDVAGAVGPLRSAARERNITPEQMVGEEGRLNNMRVTEHAIQKMDALRQEILSKAQPNVSVSTSPVAARLRAYADTLPNKPNSVAADQVRAFADQWDTRMKLADVNANIEKFNKELSYDKTTGAAIDEAHVAHAKRLAAGELRDIFYSDAETRSGYRGMANMGRVESNLINAREGLDKAGTAASVASARTLAERQGVGQAMLRAPTLKRAGSIAIERTRDAVLGPQTSLDLLNKRMRSVLFGPGEDSLATPSAEPNPVLAKPLRTTTAQFRGRELGRGETGETPLDQFVRQGIANRQAGISDRIAAQQADLQRGRLLDIPVEGAESARLADLVAGRAATPGGRQINPGVNQPIGAMRRHLFPAPEAVTPEAENIVRHRGKNPATYSTLRDILRNR
jgi:hypothetical protein